MSGRVYTHIHIHKSIGKKNTHRIIKWPAARPVWSTSPCSSSVEMNMAAMRALHRTTCRPEVLSSIR